LKAKGKDNTIVVDIAEELSATNENDTWAEPEEGEKLEQYLHEAVRSNHNYGPKWREFYRFDSFKP
jgi:hypothetical protein